MTEAKIITEEILDQAIAAAKTGHVNGLTYDQSAWCGTACCVLGFARHIAGLTQIDCGPQDEEFAESPRILAIRQLMRSPTPAILGVMEKVTAEGKIDLGGADLTDARLTDARLTGADLTRAVLTRADLTRADLTRARLTGAVLTGADLTRAVLTRADLTRARLTGADLTGADLTDARLTDARLTGARLTDADLTRADLTRADLTDADRWSVEESKYLPVTEEWLKERGAIR